MSLKSIKILIAITSIGKIWSKHRTEIKILQSLTSIGFLALFFEQERKDKDIKQRIHEYNKRNL